MRTLAESVRIETARITFFNEAGMFHRGHIAAMAADRLVNSARAGALAVFTQIADNLDNNR